MVVVVAVAAAAAGDEALWPSCWLLLVECATLFGMAPTDGCDAMTSFVLGSNEALPEAAPSPKFSPQTQTQSVRHTYSSFCGSVVGCWSSEYGLLAGWQTSTRCTALDSILHYNFQKFAFWGNSRKKEFVVTANQSHFDCVRLHTDLQPASCGAERVDKKHPLVCYAVTVRCCSVHQAHGWIEWNCT